MNKQRFKRLMETKIAVRWHMSLICLVTVASGILVSKGILWLQIAEPMIRYVISVLISYGVFFVLIYWWLRIHFGNRRKETGDSTLDALDVADAMDAGARLGHDSASVWQGEGGGFSGGGASSSWGPSNESAIESVSESAGLKSAEALDFDEGAVIVLIVTVLAAIFGSAGYLIYQAPEILFEAAFEVILAAGLVKQAKKMESEGWYYSIFKRTWWICAIVLIVAFAFGLVIQRQCPEASSFAQYRELCSNNNHD